MAAPLNAAAIKATNPKTIADCIIASGLTTTRWENFEIPGVSVANQIATWRFTPNAPGAAWPTPTPSGAALNAIFTARYGPGSALPLSPGNSAPAVPDAAHNNFGWMEMDGVIGPSPAALVALGLGADYVFTEA